MQTIRVNKLLLNFSVMFALLSIFLSWLLPNHYFPWVAAYQDFLAFLGLFFVLCFLCFRLYEIKIPSIFIVFTFVALVPLIQFAAGLIYFRGDAWMASFYLMGFSFAILVGYNIGLIPKDFSQLIFIFSGLLVLSAVVSVWIALRQWLMLPSGIWVAELPSNERPFANFAQPNNLATLLCMGLAGILFLHETRRIHFATASLIALFIIFGLVLTQSRTVWVAMLGVVFIFCFFKLFKKTSVVIHMGVKWLLFWCLIYISLLFGLSWFSEFLYLPNFNLAERAGASHRLDLYYQFLLAIIHGPLWGYGWNQVTLAQVFITPIFPVELQSEYTHNVLLDLLIWNGPVIGFAIILYGLYLFVKMFSIVLNKDLFFCFLIVFFILNHSMFEFPHAYAFFLLPLGFFVGALYSEPRFFIPLRVGRFFLVFFIILGAGLLYYVWFEYKYIEQDNRRMRFETARIGAVQTEKYIDVFFITQLQSFNSFARNPASINMTEYELDMMRKISHRYPYPPSLFRYALALAMNGYTEESKYQLGILRGLYGEEIYNEAMVGIKSLNEDEGYLQDLVDLLIENGSFQE